MKKENGVLTEVTDEDLAKLVKEKRQKELFEGVTEIGNSAFGYDFPYKNACHIVTMNIPKTITKIGRDAFLGCLNLTKVTIPDSVTEIGDGAFYHCGSLTEVTIPNSVTEIGQFAFFGCLNLTKVTISNSVKEIGERAFDECELNVGYFDDKGNIILSKDKMSEPNLTEIDEEEIKQIKVYSWQRNKSKTLAKIESERHTDDGRKM